MVRAYENLLELEANRLGYKINAPISDHNLVELKKLEQAVVENPENVDLQQQLRLKKAERERWEASVGKRRTQFEPNPDFPSIDAVRGVVIIDGKAEYMPSAKDESGSEYVKNAVSSLLKKIQDSAQPMTE
jgi:hypothetical protein